MKYLLVLLIQLFCLLSGDLLAADSTRIDGRLNDWPDPLNFSNTSQGFSYGIRNDSQYLYFAFHSNSLSVILRVLNAGMSVFIDSNGRKKERCQVDYPLKSQSAFNPGNRNDSLKRPSQEMMRQSMLMRANEFRTSGFLDSNNRRQMLVFNTPDGKQLHLEFRLNMKWTEEGLAYELAIPVKAIGFSLSRSEPLSVGIRIEGIEISGMGGGMASRPSMSSGMGAGMGGQGPGPGMGGGGGGPGGMGGPPGQGAPAGEDMSSMTQSVTVWSKFKLWQN